MDFEKFKLSRDQCESLAEYYKRIKFDSVGMVLQKAADCLSELMKQVNELLKSKETEEGKNNKV